MTVRSFLCLRSVNFSLKIFNFSRLVLSVLSKQLFLALFGVSTVFHEMASACFPARSVVTQWKALLVFMVAIFPTWVYIGVAFMSA